MTLLAEYVVDLPPSVNNLFGAAKASPAGRGRRGPRRHRTPDYNAWIALAGVQVNLQRKGAPTFRLAVAIELSFSETSGADLDNLAKAPIDLLVKQQVLEDDSKRIVRRIVLAWGSHDGCRIRIFRG